MNSQEIVAGLQAVASYIKNPVTIVIAGSAAGVLREDLPRPAGDCDVANVSPSTEEDALCRVGQQVSSGLGFTTNWLNTECIAWCDDFPAGWHERTQEYATYGYLQIRLMSRSDCAAMIVLRLLNDTPNVQRHLDDLSCMNLTASEKGFVNQYLTQLEEQDWDTSRIRFIL
jgi:hypothetical protein